MMMEIRMKMMVLQSVKVELLLSSYTTPRHTHKLFARLQSVCMCVCARTLLNKPFLTCVSYAHIPAFSVDGEGRETSHRPNNFDTSQRKE